MYAISSRSVPQSWLFVCVSRYVYFQLSFFGLKCFDCVRVAFGYVGYACVLVFVCIVSIWSNV